MTETAPEPAPPPAAAAGLRRVAIDPLTRVEGHGKVTLLLDAAGRVAQARLHIVEFRGFEKFIEGRPYWEVPVMVQRLCGICPVSHHLAASKALDAVVGGAPPPSAQALRRLMHVGQVMQSHALHFFHLAAPDLLLGVDADPARRHFFALAESHAAVARQGVALRKYGQEIIRATAGKRIHGTGSVPGGVNRHLSPADLDLLKAGWPQALAQAEQAVALIRDLHRAEAARFDAFGVVPLAWMSLVREDGGFELYDGLLRVREADGRLRFDGADPRAYLDLIEEEVRPWSYMKFPFLKGGTPAAGPTWYRVGPLARLQNCDFMPTPRAEAARQDFLTQGGGRPQHGALATHWARMVEMLYCVEAIGELLADPALLAGERLAAPGARQQRAVGVIEAPRGTLIHDYEVGADDLVRRCNLIVSTTHNNQALNETVRVVAEQCLNGRQLSEALLNTVEVAIRAFDPCLSCATHALGAMPLQLRLLDADGRCIDALQRDGDGRLERSA